MLKLNNVSKVYHLEEETVTAVDSFSYEFQAKGFYCILGKSGCGKSTLLNLMTGLDLPNDGSISYDGNEFCLYSEKDFEEYRRSRIGIIFQKYNLISELSVYDNLQIVNDLEYNGSKSNNQIADVLTKVGLAGYEKRKITELSGGEQQRVAIARALLRQSEIIFADEPTGNLDSNNTEIILSILSEISKDILVIIVTHDEMAAKRYADYILYIQDGKINSTVVNNQKRLKYSIEIKNKSGAVVRHNDIFYEAAVRLLEDCLEMDEFNVKVTKQEQLSDEILNSNANICKKTIKKSHLSKKYMLELALKFVGKKKLRMIFTCLIFAATYILLYFSLYLSCYDEKNVMTDYLVKEQPGNISIYTSAEYTNDFLEKIKRDVTKGKVLYENTSKNLSDYAYVARVEKSGVIYVDEENYFVSATIFDLNDVNACPEVSLGKRISTDSEIVITDYLAAELGIKVGDVVTDLMNEFKVCGIIETDYIQYGLKAKLLGYGNDDRLEYMCENKYFVCYTYDRVEKINLNSTREIELEASDFTDGNVERYIKKNITYISQSEIYEIKSIKGNMPQVGNEIIISSMFAEENDIRVGDTFSFIDLYDEKFNGAYNDYPNMYDYFDGRVTIVGIVDDTSYNVYVQDEILNKIAEDYNTYYRYEVEILPKGNTYRQIVHTADDKALYLDEIGISKIINFKNTVNDTKTIMYIVLVIVFIINSLMINTFIGISIEENKKNIAIMRSLGITIKSCTGIFVVEYIIIFVGALAVGLVGIGMITCKVNAIYSSLMAEKNIDIVVMNFIVLLISVLIEIIVNIYSVILPIKKIKKQRLADIIR